MQRTTTLADFITNTTVENNVPNKYARTKIRMKNQSQSRKYRRDIHERKRCRRDGLAGKPAVRGDGPEGVMRCGSLDLAVDGGEGGGKLSEGDGLVGIADIA